MIDINTGKKVEALELMIRGIVENMSMSERFGLERNPHYAEGVIILEDIEEHNARDK